MKIGDLWVKLGLKKDEFSQGMKDAGDEVKGFGGKTQAMAKVAKVAWAAIAAAVVKFATDAVKMTQRWGDAWNQTMAGIKSAYGTFVRQISSGAGWDNLFQNMAEAYRRGQEVARVLDEIFERKISYGYQEAVTEKEISELENIMHDRSKSDAERKAAADQIIEKEQTLRDLRKGILEDEAKARRDRFMDATGITDPNQVDFLVRNYNENRDIITKARAYNDEVQRLNTLLSSTSTLSASGMYVSPMDQRSLDRYAEVTAAIAKLDAETPQAVKDVAELTKAYDRGNDELVKGMADADVAVINVETDMNRAIRRANSMRGSITKATGAAADAERDQAAKILQRAQDDAKTEIQLLTEKYEQEKALLQKYGMDTTALWEEYSRKVNEIITKNLDLNVVLDDFDIGEIELPEFEIDDEEFQANIDNIVAAMDRAREMAQKFGEAVSSGFSAGVQEVADQLTGLSEINPGRIFQALLTPLADMAVREGEILVATGVGVEACKEALESLNGYAAIMAGFTLIAIGEAAKSGLAALARSGGSGTTTTSYGTSTSDVKTIQTEMTVYVTGRLSGNDILLSGKKTQNSLNR